MISSLRTIWRELPLRPVWCFRKGLTLSDAGVPLNVLVDVLANAELFCNVSKPLVERMLESMQVRNVRRGERILRQGERSDRFVLLVSGQAEVMHAKEGTRSVRSLAILNEPAGLGEEALLGAEIRSVSVLMLSDGVVMEIRRADFARLIEMHGVNWLSLEEALSVRSPFKRLCIGKPGSLPREKAGEWLCIPLEKLREQLSDLAQQVHYLCCGRDAGNAALAAFLLSQRGFIASAVQDGKKMLVR